MKTKDQTPNCPLFRLPPELRNRIYELVFEVSSASIIRVTDTFSPSGHDATDAITSARKAAAAPPSAALVRSCQRIHGESKVFFDEASKRYWKNEFLFELPIDLPHHLTFERFIKPAPTQRIENLSVMVSSEDGITTKVRLHRRGTAWSVTNEQPLFEDLGPLTGSNGIWRIRYAALST